MPKLILFNLITLDGFVAGPRGEIDWHRVDEEFNEFAVDQLNTAGALLFGRVTYELMVGYWPTAQAVGVIPASEAPCALHGLGRQAGTQLHLQGAVWKMPAHDYPKLFWQYRYSGGTGTAGDPYRIWTPEDLIALGENTDDYGKSFVLTADIDMTGQSFTVAPIAAEVEKLRQLRFTHPVPVEFLEPAAFERMVAGDPTERSAEDRETIERGAAVLRALGLMSGRVDLAKARRILEICGDILIIVTVAPEMGAPS